MAIKEVGANLKPLDHANEDEVTERFFMALADNVESSAIDAFSAEPTPCAPEALVPVVTPSPLAG